MSGSPDGHEQGRSARRRASPRRRAARAISTASRLSAPRLARRLVAQRAREAGEQSARSVGPSVASAASASSSSGTRRSSRPALHVRGPPAVAERRAGEHAGQAGAPRESPAAEEGLLGCRECSRPVLALLRARAAARSAPLVVSRVQRLERQSGTDARPPRRRAARARGRRHGGRSARPCRGRRPAMAWCASSARCGPARRRRAPRASPPPAVQPDAAARREPLVERVADQDVGEAQAAGRAGDVGDDARGHRLVERLEQLIPETAAESSERVDAELAADHRREHQHAVALVARGGSAGAR